MNYNWSVPFKREGKRAALLVSQKTIQEDRFITVKNDMVKWLEETDTHTHNT